MMESPRSIEIRERKSPIVTLLRTSNSDKNALGDREINKGRKKEQQEAQRVFSVIVMSRMERGIDVLRMLHMIKKKQFVS